MAGTWAGRPALAGRETVMAIDGPAERMGRRTISENFVQIPDLLLQL
jgi:hypothetical protein